MADHEHLHTVGVKNNAKIILIENLSTKNEDLENVDKIKEVNEEVKAKETVKEVSRGVEAVNKIRDENNQFAEQVRRVQGLVDTLDTLRTKNANPSNDAPKPASGEPPMPSSL
nr:hypothetical protein [Tanacetum cinerariifolium]